MAKRKTNKKYRRITHLRLLLPCLLMAVLVLDGLMGYTMPDPFDGIDVVPQQVYAAEAPELEELPQTGEKQVSKGPAGKLPKVDESGEYNDGEYTGTARGFGGKITVRVTISGGKITSIKIISAPGETDSYLSRAKAVIGRILKKQSTNVDAVSGATYSSNGIIKAVRNALAKAAKKKTGKTENTTDNAGNDPAPKSPVKPEAVTGGKWQDGTYIGEGEGFGGKLHVQVTIENGRITAVELLDSLDGEEFISKAKARIFTSVMQKQGTDVDSVTGATFSSYGLIQAINDALSKASSDTGDNAGEETQGGSGGGAGGSGTDSGSGTSDKVYKNGTYTRTAACTRSGWFDYDINITLTVKDGRISSLSIYKGEDWTEDEEDREENDEYLDMAVNGYGSRKGMIGRILDAQSADVDTVTGATYSSNAIRSSVKSILSEIETDKKDAGTDGQDADEEGLINEQEIMPGQQPQNAETPDGENEQAAETAGNGEEDAKAEAAENEQAAETAGNGEEDAKAEAAENGESNGDKEASSSHPDAKPESPASEPEPKENEQEQEQHSEPASPPAETAAPAGDTEDDKE